MLSYDVVILALNYALLAKGVYYVPSGNLQWNYVTYFQLPTSIQYVLEIMLNPPQKFLDFKGGKPEGPGALGFPFGIIPCTIYNVIEEGVQYKICAYKNIIVYEKYLGKYAIEVAVRPTLRTFELLPLVRDPVSPTAKALLTATAALILIGALVSILKWRELVIIPL